MKKEVDRKRYSVLDIVMLLIIGSVFVAVGVAVLTNIIVSALRPPRASYNAAIIILVLIFGLLPIVFGSIPLVMSGKQIYGWIRLNKAKKSGFETTARINDYKIVSHSKRGNMNKRYALTLSYSVDGISKKFTTDYIFDINEFRYLRKLDKIKVKVDGNFVAVTEPFTEDIYKLDPKYEIELAFYKQKPVAKVMKIWRILCSIALAWLFIGIVLTIVLNNGIYFLTGVIALLASNIPFAIIFAVFLIKWLKGKRK